MRTCKLYWGKKLKNGKIGIYINPNASGFMAARMDKTFFRKWVKEKRKLGIDVGIIGKIK